MIFRRLCVHVGQPGAGVGVVPLVGVARGAVGVARGAVGVAVGRDDVAVGVGVTEPLHAPSLNQSAGTAAGSQPTCDVCAWRQL
jgi:hypothetical protein